MMKLLRHMPTIKRPGGMMFLVSAVLSFVFLTAAFAGKDLVDNIPAKGIVTMVDLGATSCIPCKMMAPILEKMEKKYAGHSVRVVHVWFYCADTGYYYYPAKNPYRDSDDCAVRAGALFAHCCCR